MTTKKLKLAKKKADEADGELKFQAMISKMCKELILEDWDVTLVTPDELVMKDNCFVFVTQGIGEQMFSSERVFGNRYTIVKSSRGNKLPRKKRFESKRLLAEPTSLHGG